ncbi:unnamed protein product [Prunus armeniaca]
MDEFWRTEEGEHVGKLKRLRRSGIEPKFILELNFHGSMMILLMRVGELFHGESQVFCNSKAAVVVVVGFLGRRHENLWWRWRGKRVEVEDTFC